MLGSREYTSDIFDFLAPMHQNIFMLCLQEVHLSQREATNRNEIRLFSVLLVGWLQQDKVGPAHQVQVKRQR